MGRRPVSSGLWAEIAEESRVTSSFSAWIFPRARPVSACPNFLSAHDSQKNWEERGDFNSNPLVVGAAQLSQNEPG